MGCQLEGKYKENGSFCMRCNSFFHLIRNLVMGLERLFQVVPPRKKRKLPHGAENQKGAEEFFPLRPKGGISWLLPSPKGW